MSWLDEVFGGDPPARPSALGRAAWRRRPPRRRRTRGGRANAAAGRAAVALARAGAARAARAPTRGVDDGELLKRAGRLSAVASAVDAPT